MRPENCHCGACRKLTLRALTPWNTIQKPIVEGGAPMTTTIDGKPQAIQPGERLIDLINRCGIEVPQVCYHPQLGPIQTCDTCMVEVDGKLVRACGTAGRGRHERSYHPRRVRTQAQREAFDRILGNHLLYCTVCDNNNGNCTVHNTTKLLAVEHQEIPYKPKPYEVDMSNPFYRYDPDQCILCGRCVQACQTLQVNETLSIRLGGSASPRVMGRRRADRRIELRLLRPLRHGLPLQRADGKVDARRGRLLYRAAEACARRHDRCGQGHRAGGGLWRDSCSSLRWKSHMRESRIKRTKTVCTYCGVGCSFDIWTKDRHILKVEPAARPGQRRFHLHQGQVRLGLRQQPRPAHQAADPRRRHLPRSLLG